jgi:hypothetical protein
MAYGSRSALEKPFPPAPGADWMLITKHFLLIHVPKTGGTFIREVCREHLPQDWFIPNELHRHTPYDKLPDEFRRLPMICFVRNPWDWYVSWYHHMIENYAETDPGPIWVSAFNRGRNDFKETVINACTGRNFQNKPVGSVMRKLGLDYYTALYTVKVGRGMDEGRIEVGKFESLREDFLDFLSRHEIPVGPGFVDAIRNGPRQNTTKHRPHREYYDDELRELVGARCRIVTEYDYAFEGEGR